jgi:hypothetical protein
MYALSCKSARHSTCGQNAKRRKLRKRLAARAGRAARRMPGSNPSLMISKRHQCGNPKVMSIPLHVGGNLLVSPWLPIGNLDAPSPQLRNSFLPTGYESINLQFPVLLVKLRLYTSLGLPWSTISFGLETYRKNQVFESWLYTLYAGDISEMVTSWSPQICIWVNYNISLTWFFAAIWG